MYKCIIVRILLQKRFTIIVDRRESPTSRTSPNPMHLHSLWFADTEKYRLAFGLFLALFFGIVEPNRLWILICTFSHIMIIMYFEWVGLYFAGETSVKPGWCLWQVGPQNSPKEKVNVSRFINRGVYYCEEQNSIFLIKWFMARIAQSCRHQSLKVVDIQLIQARSKKHESQQGCPG